MRIRDCFKLQNKSGFEFKDELEARNVKPHASNLLCDGKFAFLLNGLSGDAVADANLD